MLEEFPSPTPPGPRDFEFVDWRQVVTELRQEPTCLRKRPRGVKEVHAVLDRIQIRVHFGGFERSRGRDGRPFLHGAGAIVRSMEHREKMPRQCGDRQRRDVGQCADVMRVGEGISS